MMPPSNNCKRGLASHTVGSRTVRNPIRPFPFSTSLVARIVHCANVRVETRRQRVRRPRRGIRKQIVIRLNSHRGRRDGRCSQRRPERVFHRIDRHRRCRSRRRPSRTRPVRRIVRNIRADVVRNLGMQVVDHVLADSLRSQQGISSDAVGAGESGVIRGI